MSAGEYPLSPDPAVEWAGGKRRYDLVKEFVIALAAVTLLTLLLTVLFSSPDVKSVTIARWATADPQDFLATALSELDGTSGEMIARVNGEERSRGNLADMHWSWEQIVATAARNTVLRPGDIIGSGTVGTGCILEHGDGRWLQPGDVVELEVEGIGILRNTVGVRSTPAIPR